MKILKPKFWHGKNTLLSFFFLPLSVLLQLLIFFKKILTKRKKFSIPIICVGNIYLGGTGKTPLCIKLVEIFKKLSKQPIIIKQFYKAHEDEYNLIKSKKISLFKITSRAVAIKNAEIENFDCVILDDGFQDYSIYKDLNIICFNGEQLDGNGMTIPSGPLREPLSSIKNAQIVIINGKFNEVFEQKIKAKSKNISIYYSDYLPSNLNQFVGQNLLAFAGIGNPNNFFDLLEKNNLNISKKITYPDHYDYSMEELDNIIKYSISNKLKIITTEKDYFRIKRYNISEIKYLEVKLQIKDEHEFIKEVEKWL